MKAPQIYLLDRGFPSVGLIQKLNEHNKKFVIRVAKNFSSEVIAFRESKETDVIISITYTKSRTRTNRKSTNLILPYIFNLRLVKIQLSSGEIEILITNLFSSDFSKEDIYTLYGKRWGIETSYNIMKDDILMEQWCTILENSIKQEFYAKLIIFNLSSILKQEAQIMNDIKKKEPKEFININMWSVSVKQ